MKSDLGDAYRISEKMERQDRVRALLDSAIAELAGGDDAVASVDDVSGMFGKV